MSIARGFILHTDDGAYACRPERIADFEGSLRANFANQRRLARKVFQVEGLDVDVAAGQDLLCSAKLPSVRLDTYYGLHAEGVLVPYFGRTELRLALEWPVPQDMELRFAAQLAWSVAGRWHMGECFLFARKQGVGGFWKLPLPNVYADGRVCMGDEVRGTVRADGAQECFAKALQSFRATTWNTDIAPEPGRCRQLFRWDQARQPLPVPQDWQTRCTAVSRVEMEELCPA